MRQVLPVLSKRQNPIGNPRLQFIKSGAFVPAKTRTSLRIGAAFAVAASTTNTNTVLSGNNLFDPLLSSGTRRCAGWTQLSAQYNRYRVIGSKIIVKAAMGSSATAGVTQINGAICVYPNNTGLGATNFIDNNSRPFARYADLNTGESKTLVVIQRTSDLTGNRNVEGSDRTQALISAAPGEEWYWIISCVSDAAYTNGQVVFDVQLTYDVEFFDRTEIDPAMEKLYEQIYELRVKQLSGRVKPGNQQHPWNESKMHLHDGKSVDRESKVEQSKKGDDTEWEDSDVDLPLDVLRSKAKEAQRKLALAENDVKLETASKKGK